MALHKWEQFKRKRKLKSGKNACKMNPGGGVDVVVGGGVKW